MTGGDRAALALRFGLTPAQADDLPAETARWLLALARMP